jgi:DNA-binding LacI/PurR family transcriptional regulator
VLLGRRPARYDGPFVGTDNVAGARAMVRYLIDLGHRRIAHLTRADAASSAIERMRGYRIALVDEGMAPAGDLIHRVAANVEGGTRAAAWLARLRPRPTALFAYNDSQAVGAMLALADAGIAVPEACSVAGFDDIELARLVRPALTTVAQPVEDIGRLGAKMLMDRLQHDAPGGTMLLPPRLVPRQSTAAPQRVSARAASAGTARSPART